MTYYWAAALALYVLFHALVALLLLRRVWYNRHLMPQAPGQWPTVSVLVAARNEEANLPRCLEALLQQDYPGGRMEVLVGNDRSEDATGTLARAVGAYYPHLHVHDITTDLPGQRGKQNVLAQLAHHAQGQVLLVTDADIAVQPGWARLMVGALSTPDKRGQLPALVSGPTVVTGSGAWAALQRLDWLYGIGVFQAYAEAGHPVTAVGNNMGIWATKYRQLGGYEALPFSITEDYRLYEAVRGQGWRSVWPFHAQVVNWSAPLGGGLGRWLHQRRRWFRGGQEAPWWARGVFYMQLIMLPALLSALVLAPVPWGLALALTYVIANATSMAAAGTCLAPRRRVSWLLALPLHQLYLALSVVILPLYFLIPVTFRWKGRPYR